MTGLASEGRPFLAGAAILAVALWVSAGFLPWPAAALAALSTVVAGFMAYFFRDPERAIPDDRGIVVAPADGRILSVTEVDEPDFLGVVARRISIFLSIFSVHVQRAPLAGMVRYRSYRPGRFQAAWNAEASQSNEQASLGLESRSGRVLVRQIAGLVARRIETYPRDGDSVERGDRIGIIRFGSRVDLFVPVEWPVVCSVGEKVKGGVTVVAQEPSREGGSVETE
jgi:phosphatidylserine decarboxylase